ncbi:X-linked retinitis pigmentosa GTPase regulator-interacting protein 1 [Alligator mississippiensis]|uniref:X-linked retinitis pigmentosa GTPase regulator-interacting protein 1 n=1 Tax=Alligator mississippiensis TaxID=8496 RepID=UPI002877ABB9|nr:X-linked retinitis pigmentosa GTPase regulator-interacting protein 1 [Alligator mississippiensis]
MSPPSQAQPQPPMALLLLDETAGDLPVRDTDQPLVIAAIQDVSAAAPPAKAQALRTWLREPAMQARQRISRVSREELEDRFLRLHDQNLLLKEFACKQQDRIKRLGARLMRLTQEHQRAARQLGPSGHRASRDLELEEALEELQARVRELEHRNEGLRGRLLAYKQQLQLGAYKHHGLYGHIPARVDTGLRRAHTASGRGPERQRKGVRMQGPEARHTHTAPPQYIDHSREEPGTALDSLTRGLGLEELASESPLRGEMEPTWQSRWQASERRVAIRGNVELIRLQRLLQERDMELAVTTARCTELQQTYESQLQQRQEVLGAASSALLAQAEELSTQLKGQTQRAAVLESQLEGVPALHRALEELQERVRDLEKERDLLKEAHDNLLASALDSGRLPRQDTPQLEKQLSTALAEKRVLLAELEAARAQSQVLQQDSSQLLLAPAQDGERLQDKASQTMEQGPVLPPPQPPSLDGPLAGLGQQDLLVRQSLSQRLCETEAVHAETVLELEKTRDMLILQHRINRDYQAELEGTMLQAEQAARGYEEEQQRLARLLDLRSTRLHQLEEQLKDVAYGTQPLPPASNRDSEGDGAGVRLGRGESLLELHVVGASLSGAALRVLGDAQPTTFCTYAVYDFETHATPLGHGARPRYGFTSRYVLRAEPLLLHYLQGSAARLDLHVAVGTEHRALATCHLRLAEALATTQRVHATAALQGPSSEDYGLLEYWLRLRPPLQQGLRLQQERTKALGYLSASVTQVGAPSSSWQPCSSDGPPGRERLQNELQVRVRGCRGLRSRCLGALPSPYAMYRFFTFPDRDTPIVPASHSPHFGDLQTFPMHPTPELHRYLRHENLWVYVFDDEDPQPDAYLGKAAIPLLPLARGHSITGDFVLMDPFGHPNGSINLSLEWQHQYLSPEGILGLGAPSTALQQPEPRQRKLHVSAPKPEAYTTKRLRQDQGMGGPARPSPGLMPAKHAAQESKAVAAQEPLAQAKEREAQAGVVAPAARSSREEATQTGKEGMSKSPTPSQRSELESPMPDIATPTKDTAPADADQELESSSDAPTTDSDEIVVGAEPQRPPKTATARICIEVISLSLWPGPEAMASGQRVYVEYRFPGVPLAETETPVSLRLPRVGEWLYFHFSKVIDLDVGLASAQQETLQAMLQAEEPQQSWLQFVVVSEPLPGTGGECEDLGIAYVDLREILWTGNDVLEHDLDVFSSLALGSIIGKLKVSVEAAAALRAVYWEGGHQARTEKQD